MEVNVLITSVSRKVWLVKAFKEALQREKISGKVVATDIDPLSAGFAESDTYHLVPPSSDPDFIEANLNVCEEEKINLIIPTRDGELSTFAKHKKTFEDKGIRVMISSEEAIEICNDKLKFFEFLTDNGFKTPSTTLGEQIDYESVKFPVVVKSRFGSGGSSVFKANSEHDLKFFIYYAEDPIVQSFIEGKEYTIDLFADFSGKVISIVPRERIEVLSGESYKGRTVKDQGIIDLSKKLAESLKLIGHNTLQCIKHNGEVYFLEINPRFGGGAHLGFKAGAFTPGYLVRLVAGKPVESQIGTFKENIVMLRHTNDFFVEGDTVSKERVL